MGDTAISWTDKTWNCIRGCTRVSKGCMHCYAETTARRFAGPGGPYEGLVETKLRVINADEPDKGNKLVARWTGEIKFVTEHLGDPLTWGKPCLVFVASMSDPFHEKLTNEQIAAMYGVMALAKRHTFQMLTKRSRRRREWFAWVEKAARECNGGVGMTIAAFCIVMAKNHDSYFDLYGNPTPINKAVARGDWYATAWPLPNVWEGTSTEDQDAADDRIVDLLATPAAIRFISAEPLLGAIDLEHLQKNGEFEVNALAGTHGVTRPHAGRGEKLDWVIAGCESGPGARPCDYRWLRSLRNQCERNGTAFFLKQAKSCFEDGDDARYSAFGGMKSNGPSWVICGGEGAHKKGGGIFERPYLDGRQHLEFPR